MSDASNESNEEDSNKGDDPLEGTSDLESGVESGLEGVCSIIIKGYIDLQYLFACFI